MTFPGNRREIGNGHLSAKILPHELERNIGGILLNVGLAAGRDRALHEARALFDADARARKEARGVTAGKNRGSPQ